jgi:hypothetical protein
VQLKPRKINKFEVLKTSVQNSYENRGRRVSSGYMRSSQNSSKKNLKISDYINGKPMEVPHPHTFSIFFDKLMSDPTNGAPLRNLSRKEWEKFYMKPGEDHSIKKESLNRIPLFKKKNQAQA